MVIGSLQEMPKNSFVHSFSVYLRIILYYVIAAFAYGMLISSSLI